SRADTSSLRWLLCPAMFALVVTLASTTVTEAQQRCAEGRTSAGKCVDPLLAADARRTAILASQPRLSLTIQPVLPSVHAYVRESRPGTPIPTPTGILAPN